ncbi:MAG: HAD-IA family hydrolase [Sphingopyxis sp.]|uniref:HAD-IA family hydrolase n=1 Tax=Sphingopyxis sp. TaxID=1908224 RepID=UPI002ABC39F4|nr:HAD-IA family hydrolase [Sphingopyxis sp.]MDZ3831074.1 HAD-IA family hydrolase [Sphingopyxis sp.]
MAPFPFRIVGFDLDGTLLDTSAELAASLNHALAADGRQAMAVDEVRALIGGGGRQMLTMALERRGGGDEALVDRLYAVLIDHYRAHMGRDCRPYPGLMAALDGLDAAGAILGVATNKSEPLARALLAATGLLDRFVTVIGGDTLGPGRLKPAPDSVIEMARRCGGGRAAFIGDSPFDVAAARGAGVTSVAVGFGFAQVPVAALGADHSIHHYDELLPLLASL